LDMGFIPDVERIVGLLPPLRQTLFFSATLAREIRRLGDKFLHNPKEVRVDPPASPAETVSHVIAPVSKRDKQKTLCMLLKGNAVSNALIFCNRKRDVDTLNRALKRHGFEAAALHGDMPQSARSETLDAFKRGKVRFLVATDVAGRGLDVYGLSHVFNFDVPIHAEDYVHRIGRTGRAGHRGRAITLAAPDDATFVAAIERLIKRDIPRIGGVDGEVPATAAEETKESEATAAKEEKEGARKRRPGRKRTKAAKETAPAKKARDAGKARRTPKRKPAAETPPAKAARREGKAKRKEKAGKKEPVVGLGDHVPAFLLRPTRSTDK
ncbi:MAG: helicase-related protein, partial [Alphaproteobacteria bacterium]